MSEGKLAYKYFNHLWDLLAYVNENNIKVLNIFPDSYEMYSNGKLNAKKYTLVYVVTLNVIKEDE